MAQQTIGLGASANDGTGDPIRTAFGKVNANFTELYAGVPLNNLTAIVDPDQFADSGLGYGYGSQWNNTVTRSAFVCVDPSNDAALWVRYADLSFGAVRSIAVGYDPTPADDVVAWPGLEYGLLWIEITSPSLWFCANPGTGAGDADWRKIYPAAGGSPGGSNKQVQYNNSSAFGGAAGVTIEGTGQAKLDLGTITASAKALEITGTFNDAGTVFAAPLFLNVVNTNSGAGSNIVDFQVNGASAFAVAADGLVTIGALSLAGNLTANGVNANAGFGLNNGGYAGFLFSAASGGTRPRPGIPGAQASGHYHQGTARR
jgi:hypothetical protein